jgi:hypothetical protein
VETFVLIKLPALLTNFPCRFPKWDGFARTILCTLLTDVTERNHRSITLCSINEQGQISRDDT